MNRRTTGWTSVINHVERQSPCLSRLRVSPSHPHKSSNRLIEPLPSFLKIAISSAVQISEADHNSAVRLAMVAPRWGNGVFWTAVGASLCALKRDFEQVRSQLPNFPVGQKLLLDNRKVVQFDGEDEQGLWLRVSTGRLRVPKAYRLRLQPTTTRRPLSPLNWSGQAPSDALDELLDIDCQGARHVFSNRVILVTSVARGLEMARSIQATSNSHHVIDELPHEVRALIRQVRMRFFTRGEQPAETGNASLYQLLQDAEELAARVDLRFEEREHLVSLLQSANMELRRLYRYHTQMSKSSDQLIRAIALSRPAGQGGASPTELLNLFQWGALNLEGVPEIKSGGQMEAEPVLLLAPDLLSLREYLRERNREAKKDDALGRPLLVLDGSATFRNRPDVLSNVLDLGCPMLVCLERGEEENTPYLAQQGFEIWKWAAGDLAELMENSGQTGHSPVVPSRSGSSIFHPLQTALTNYSRHQLQEHPCAHDEIDKAADQLIRLLAGMDAAQPETKTLESTLYGCLLHAARMMVPPARSDVACSASYERWHNRLQRAKEEIADCGLWLSAEVSQSASHIISALEDTVADLEANAELCGKMEALLDVALLSEATKIAVVVAEADDVAPSTQYWKPLLEGSGKTVTFCCPATAEACLSQSSVEHLIICGWLGAGRMRHLLDGCLAADITILLYPFERGWLRGALRRWRGHDQCINAKRKAQLLKLDKTSLPDHQDEALTSLSMSVPERENMASQFDVSGFEMRLRVHRRASLAGAGRTGEETEPARLIEFSGGHFAFMSDSCNLPLVNDLLHRSSLAETDAIESESARRSELPQKRASELAVGDYVVFRRGATGNLIREMADVGLKQSGQGHLRQVSRLWKIALREWFEEEKQRAIAGGKDSSTRAIIRQLQRAGVDRGAPTIIEWLERDRRIGPADEASLVTIAHVTQHEELNRKLPDVWRAISKVRGAHLQASDHLARALMQRLPDYLKRNFTDGAEIDSSLEVEIEGVGAAVVVRVEEIAEEHTEIARSHLNFLQQETDDVPELPLDIEVHHPTGQKPDARENTLERTAALDREIERMLRKGDF